MLDRGYDFERNREMLMPLKTLVDAGAPYVISTDAHVSRSDDEIKYDAKMLDWQWGNSIWPFLAPFIDREIGGRAWNPAEGIDRIAVIKGITINGAKYVLREKDLGSLEKGKLADFIVIDKDYFTIPVKEIYNIQTLLTAVGGKVVYRNTQF